MFLCESFILFNSLISVVRNEHIRGNNEVRQNRKQDILGIAYSDKQEYSFAKHFNSGLEMSMSDLSSALNTLKGEITDILESLGR